MDTNRVVTIAVFQPGKPSKVLLEIRGTEPELGKWALPGGHVDENERDIDAARRELLEETGIHAKDLLQVNSFRDGHGIIDTLFAGFVSLQPPHAGSDAKKARWIPINEVPRLAFNHNEMISLAMGLLELKEYRQRTLTESKKKFKNGKLFVFEGIDGSGKSTQCHLLLNWLRRKDYKVEHTKWNSSPLIADHIKVLKEKKALSPLLYSLMHAADMIARYENEISPALDKGKIVISDRYIYTSYIRDKIRGIDTAILDAIYEDIVEPDAIFLFKTPVEVAVGRLLDDKDLNYYNSGMDIGYSDNMNESCIKYERAMSKEYQSYMKGIKNCHIIDADRPKDEIATEIRKIVKGILKLDEEIFVDPELLGEVMCEDICY